MTVWASITITACSVSALPTTSKKAVPDEWLSEQDILIDDDRSYTVEFGDFAVTSKLVNIDVPGYGQPTKNRLRLFDLASVDDGLVPSSSIDFDKTKIAKNLTLFLYPDDSDEQGRLLRIYQEYFMVSNAAQLLIAEAVERGSNLHDLADYAVVQINDTHPTMIIPELIRLLTTEHDIEFDEAVTIVRSMVAYTNHTILAEALEKWPLASLQKVSPAIADIIVKLDEVAKPSTTTRASPSSTSTTPSTWPTWTSTLASPSMASPHSTPRFWRTPSFTRSTRSIPRSSPTRPTASPSAVGSMAPTPALASLLDDVIGTDWRSTGDLSKLAEFANDKDVLERLAATKAEAKTIMRQFMALEQGVAIPSNAIIASRSSASTSTSASRCSRSTSSGSTSTSRTGNSPSTPSLSSFGGKAAPALYHRPRISST